MSITDSPAWKAMEAEMDAWKAARESQGNLLEVEGTRARRRRLDGQDIDLVSAWYCRATNWRNPGAALRLHSIEEIGDD